MNARIAPEDEYPHTFLEDPLWREGYHFNGYDPVSRTGITISIGIKPFLGYREEVVAVHTKDPLVFMNVRSLGSDNGLSAGTLKVEPVEPLERWRMRMKDTFQTMENGIPSGVSEDVEFDLHFNSAMPPHKYTTQRGERYEQPGPLEGRLQIGDNSSDFKGNGMRDHSWEIRDMTVFTEWYSLMGWLIPDTYVFVNHFRIDSASSWEGWLKTDSYYEVNHVQVESVFLGNVLRECKMKIATAEDQLEFAPQVLSFYFIQLGGATAAITETVVELGKNGYAFLWYGRK